MNIILNDPTPRIIVRMPGRAEITPAMAGAGNGAAEAALQPDAETE
jgi:hypothetical protein